MQIWVSKEILLRQSRNYNSVCHHVVLEPPRACKSKSIPRTYTVLYKTIVSVFFFSTEGGIVFFFNLDGLEFG